MSISEVANIYRLRVFVEVVECLSFSRAAHRLFLSQPAVSNQIKMLEQAIGAPLFENRTRKLTLTEAAHALYGHARRMIVLADELEASMNELKGAMAGRLAVGIALSWEQRLPRLLFEFQTVHPQVMLSIAYAHPADLPQMLVGDRLQLAFFGQDPRDNRLEVTTIGEERVNTVVIAPWGHPLARRTVVAPHALNEFPFVLYPPRRGGAFIDYLKQLGISPRYALEIESLEGLKEAVANGVGISVLRANALVPGLDQNRFSQIPLEAPAIRQLLIVARDRSRSPSNLERLLIQHVTSRFQSLPALEKRPHSATAINDPPNN